ncbi:MAG TPA: formylglycine-generating enzyme family protein [Gemmatimonadaceae bacterium]|nr:formylglycine-generating enzyme family protein [Gemmatimonadaceae bacterium]
MRIGAFWACIALCAQPAAGTVFRDCRECPEMVVVPAGTFVIGSSAAEKAWAASHGTTMGSVADEEPRLSVSLRAFALGKYDVTRGEYSAFVRETGRATFGGCGHDGYPWVLDTALSWERPGFPQSDRDPVVCVSWHDARAYVAWLNSKVHGSSYRLPSETEWEYAARGGTSTWFWWGDDDSGATRHAWYKDNADGHTHPVGLRPANGFGLFDIVGDVWQWTADCYADYAKNPADGAPVDPGSSCLKGWRVDRGGSWLHRAWMLRPATRERKPDEFRDRTMGFRVAKTL